MKTKTIYGQPSWQITSSTVEAWLTKTGGHLGPITFRLGGRKIAPFSVAPWWNEKLDRSIPTILRVLRGDFFCMPFGGNATMYRGERHPVHGEVANSKWTLEAGGKGRLHASLKTKVRRGRVDKHVVVRDGETVVYQQHVISKMAGPMALGHHAMVKFPDEPGSGFVSTSRFVHGQVYPEQFENPANGGYQSLKPGGTFTRLDSVPMLTGAKADLSRYPARRGFEDLVMLVSDPRLPFAWTAVAFPKQRFVWFALKDPRVLRHTVFWITNGGRHMAPWNGRHVSVMGLEEVTSHFHPGLAESVAGNPLAKRGYPTSVQLNPKKPLVVNYIMAVAAIPAGFDHVRDIRPASGGVELRSVSGKKARAKVDLRFLTADALK